MQMLISSMNKHPPNFDIVECIFRKKNFWLTPPAVNKVRNFC